MCVRLWWPIGKEIMPPIAHVALLHMHIGIVCCWKGIAELELDMVCHCSPTSDFDVCYQTEITGR